MEPGKRVVKTEQQDPNNERSLEHVSHVERVCLHNLLDSSTEAIYFKDLDNRFLLVSKGVMQHHIDRERKNGASENLDLGPDYYVGKTDLDLYDTALATEWMAEERRMIETAEPMVDVLERDSSDAFGGWFRTSKAPLRDEDGSIIGTFGISRDVTAQVVAEQELARREAQLRAVLDSSPDVIACYNQDLRYEMINAKAAVLLGTAPEKVVGRTDEELERGILDAVRLGLVDVARTLSVQLGRSSKPKKRARWSSSRRSGSKQSVGTPGWCLSFRATGR